MIEFTTGDTEKVVVPVKNEDTDTWVSDLTTIDEATYRLTTRRGGGDTVVEKTYTSGDITIEPVTSIADDDLDSLPDSTDVLVITVTQNDTDAVDPGTYYHEVEIDFGTLIKTVVPSTEVKVTKSST